MTDTPAKYTKGEWLTACMRFYNRVDVVAIGKAQSVRNIEGRGYLYQLEWCDTPGGIFLAWENELHPTAPEDRAQLEAQNV